MENKAPEISVIVPVYNREDNIGSCIESIQDQNFHDYELILVDDGSSDSTLQVCQKYAENDERIVIFHKENGGASSARNFGIRKARGKWIAFIDSDDSVKNKYLDVLYRNAVDTGADISICGYYWEQKEDWFNKNSRIVKVPVYALNSSDKVMKSFTRTDFLNHFPELSMGLGDCQISYCTVSKLYERSIVEEFPEDIVYGEDKIFNIHALAKSRKIVFSSELLYVYKYNPSGIMGEMAPRKFSDDLKVFKEKEWFYNTYIPESKRKMLFLEKKSLLAGTVHERVVRDIQTRGRVLPHNFDDIRKITDSRTVISHFFDKQFFKKSITLMFIKLHMYRLYCAMLNAVVKK